MRLAHEHPEDYEERIEQMFDYADVLQDIEELEVDAAVADHQDERA